MERNAQIFLMDVNIIPRYPRQHKSKRAASFPLQAQRFGGNNPVQAWIAGSGLVSPSRAGSTHRYTGAANNPMNYGKRGVFPLSGGGNANSSSVQCGAQAPAGHGKRQRD